MKVKELKELLKKANDEEDVFFADTDQNAVAIVDGNYSDAHECVYLFTRHSFPDEWLDPETQSEKRVINGVKVSLSPLKGEVADLSLTNKKVFGDFEEHIHTFKCYDGYAECVNLAGLRMVYPKLAELTDEQLDDINDHVGGRCTDSKVVTPLDVCLLYGTAQYSGIMNETNGHNEHLVEQINEKWLKFKKFFRPILIALYTRDIDDITNTKAFEIPKWLEFPEYEEGRRSNDWGPYNKRCLDDMVERWDLFAENYLMHNADDQDLETIITYVRYDVCEEYS